MRLSKLMVILGDYLTAYGDLEVYQLVNDRLYEPLPSHYEDEHGVSCDMIGLTEPAILMDCEPLIEDYKEVEDAVDVE